MVSWYLTYTTYLKKSVFTIRRYGIKRFIAKAKEKLSKKALDRPQFNLWIEKNEPDEAQLMAQRCMRFSYEPRISIIVPVFNTRESFLDEMIRSVLDQTYSGWELCIADGASRKPHVRKVLEEYSVRYPGIKVKYLTENKRIAGNSNEALSLATGEFIAFLDHDDILAPFALYEVVKTINENPDVDFIYSDEDIISEDGKESVNLHFKPDWSPDTLRSYNYITHFTVIRRSLLDKAGYFKEGYEGSQDYDLFLRATEQTGKIVHVPKVLYHWRACKGSAAEDTLAKPYAFESARKALKDHLTRIGLEGNVGDGLFPSSYKENFEINNKPKISIIIPNNNHANILKKCIKSILNKSTYKNYEIIVVENNSTDEKTFIYYDELKKMKNIRIIEWKRPFNYSAVNNFAVSFAEGGVLLFLNNDMEVINSDWLERMLEHAVRKGVGTVGAKLYYPDNTIQHAGVIVGIGWGAGHSHKGFPRESPGYFARLQVVQNLSAVTGACLMTRRDVFEEVGGFDEGYALALSDIDLCMKFREKGYLIVWTPYAELYHYESTTRGYEDTPEKQERFRQEIELFQKKWKHILGKGDPYYSPNLTLDKEDFSLRI